MKLLSSKTWRQLKPSEAWVAGQRWYCDCQTKYKAKNGCVVEIKQGDQYFYMKADCPDHEFLDIRAMRHEEQYGGHLSPAELYASLPVCQPAATSFVTHLPNGRARFEHRGLQHVAAFRLGHDFPVRECSWRDEAGAHAVSGPCLSVA